ncbi:MAG TPA: DUF4260 domain-containing protein [Rhizomicrobium sp.]|nr:DUF4260 domain-containing protein [Rhizomicrobium sp.]
MSRLEGLALLAAGLAPYARLGGDWMLFAKLFLLPDLSFAAYLFGPRAGAFAYNAMHSTLGALALGAFGYLTGEPFACLIALIWLCHIGFDRALGYGLKYASAFGDTHLGRVGRHTHLSSPAERHASAAKGRGPRS